MHQKEFQKTKNTTGRMTHLSLPHSHLFVGIDFSHHRQLNELLANPLYTPFILYPDDNAINVSDEALPLKTDINPLFILIDSTWGCSKKLMKLSKNLKDIPRISFNPTLPSNYRIKKQPEAFCLSTIETVQHILGLLNQQGVESLSKSALHDFLNPFQTMVDYQILKAQTESSLRFKASDKSAIIASKKEVGT